MSRERYIIFVFEENNYRSILKEIVYLIPFILRWPQKHTTSYGFISFTNTTQENPIYCIFRILSCNENETHIYPITMLCNQINYFSSLVCTNIDAVQSCKAHRNLCSKSKFKLINKCILVKFQPNIRLQNLGPLKCKLYFVSLSFFSSTKHLAKEQNLN